MANLTSAVYDTEYGKFQVVCDAEEVIAINIVNENTEILKVKECELCSQVYKELLEYFKGKRKSFDFKISMRGTDFQKTVWKELIKIPYGETRSYKEVAEAIGKPKACRAVGMANNRNPLVIVVPCHRVIGSNGSLTGYYGGLDMKNKLLKLESLNKDM